ncbi:hypothetical protein L596_007200 [Steinernema carpocapsae]|uniref:GST C-terminal domain-containing protein n=1 Tax=Steinernema carpocapsae TaxID=34508 RepID=A0A4U5P8I3_STECR|nr:hypothetical protein L596_007200 [Steinernema carpocapsae]
MELQVWPSDFGLPSVDTDCLQFMACAKFCAAPINIVMASSPWKSTSGGYPVLTSGQETITNINHFVDFLRKSAQEVVLDGDSTVAERSSFDAYSSLLRKTIYPAQLQFMWLDKSNYGTVTHHWLSSKLPFPYNMFYMERRRRKAQNYIDALGRNESQILADAIQTINLLSAKLGDNKYFCGDKPCSLDALIFGHLAPFLKLPMPTDRLTLHLSACPNLVRFVESIISIYLPLSEDDLRNYDRQMWLQRKMKTQKEIESKKTHKEQKKSDEGEAGESDCSVRDTIIFIIGALTISLVFAVHSGIVSVSVEDEEEAVDID